MTRPASPAAWPDYDARLTDDRHRHVVRRQRPRPAVAAARHERLGGAGQRGDAAADPGGTGRAGLARVDGPLADPGRPGRGPAGGGDPDVGPARLPPPGDAPARLRGRAGGAARRPGARRPRRAAGAAGHRRPTPPGRWPPSRTGSGTRWWTPTSAGWCRGRSSGAARRGPGHDGRRPDRDAALLPDEPARAARASTAFMELGALICTARSPQLRRLPVRGRLRLAAERRARSGRSVPAPQRYAGTDRQVRGLILEVLRHATGPVPRQRLDVVWPDECSGPGRWPAWSPTVWSSRTATSSPVRPADAV